MNRMIAMLRRFGSLAAVVVLPLWTTAAHAVIPASQRAVLLNLYTSTTTGLGLPVPTGLALLALNVHGSVLPATVLEAR